MGIGERTYLTAGQIVFSVGLYVAGHQICWSFAVILCITRAGTAAEFCGAGNTG